MSAVLTVVLAIGVVLLLGRYAFATDAYRRAKVAKGAHDYQRDLRTAPWRMDIAAKGVRRDMPSMFTLQDDEHLESLRQKVLRDLALAVAGAVLFLIMLIVIEIA